MCWFFKFISNDWKACKPDCFDGNICVDGECKCGNGLGCFYGHKCVNGACKCGNNEKCGVDKPYCYAPTGKCSMCLISKH